MNTLQQFSQLPFSHHAYGIESSHIIYSQLQKLLPKQYFSYIVHKQYDTFKIGDAREIKSLQSEKTDKASLFVLEFSLINTEAQNALLKVLEEPSSQTYFILVFPNIKKLLPTLQSRLHLIRYESDANKVLRLSAEDFIAMSLRDRFEFIKKHTDKKSEELLTKSDVLHFLNDCEHYFYQKKKFTILPVLFQARNSLSANGASIKMILDMLALHI